MTTSTEAALDIEGLRIGYGQTQVLHVEHLGFPRNAITALVGPVAAGKSTLVRHLVGLDELVPASWAAGSVRAHPANPNRPDLPTRILLIPQKARLYLGTLRENILSGSADVDHAGTRLHQLLADIAPGSQLVDALDKDVGLTSLAVHRAGLVCRALLENPDILLLDEPLSDVAIADEDWLLDLLGRLRRRLTVIMVSHNKNQVRKIADWVVFITGGQVIEVTTAERFFAAPTTELAREFLRSGSAWPAPRLIDDEVDSPPEPVPAAAPATFREMGLRWVLPRRLGGMHQPGLLGDIDGDLQALAQLGVTHLVSLIESPLALEGVDNAGIRVTWFPIDDMRAPDIEACRALLDTLCRDFDSGDNLLFHCRGGLGRTGLMLACFLIAHRDMSAAQAIEHVRKINPNYIQSQVQIDFVKAFTF